MNLISANCVISIIFILSKKESIMSLFIDVIAEDK